MEKDIDKITKNPETDIVIRIDDFGGRTGLTIREFVKSPNYTGFTKTGIRIPGDKFKYFKQAINSIDEADFASDAQETLPVEKEKTAHKKPSTQKKQDIEEVEY